MTAITKDQLTSAAISLRVDGKPSFMLLLTKEGDVKRMGYSVVTNDQKTVAVGHDPWVFGRFISALPEDVLEHSGSYEGEGAEGDRVVCRIELGGAPEPVSYEMTYHALSSTLPRAMASIVDLGEALTDEWYSDHLPSNGAGAEGEPTGASPAGDGAPAWLVSAESDSVGVVYDEGAPVHADPVEEPTPAGPSGEGAEKRGDEVTAEPERAEAPTDPTASKKRFALAILLDLSVLAAAYNVLVLFSPGGGLPLGAALFFLVLVEFCLLQFVRRSPGYWLLGMTAGLGEFPKVDPERLAGESLVTHIVAVLLLSSGLEGLTAWTAYQDPIPYFGLSIGSVFSVLLSLLFAAGLIAAGVLIFRNDLRGVWVGSGALAFSFLSLWTARGPELNGWLRLELMAQAAAEGRPVEATALDGVLELVMPIVFATSLLYAVGLYFAWRRLRPSRAAAPAEAGE